jgi:AcrR family transcriptional regulator
MRISDLEARSGFRRSTIQYYLREGILHPPDKTGRTMAYYDETHLQRLRDIHRVKMAHLKKTKNPRISIETLKDRFAKSKPSSPFQKTKSRKTRTQKILRSIDGKNDILEAATRIYLKQGYYPTRVQDVAREAGISLPTFYKYFPDKRELFFEVIANVNNSFLNKSREALQGEEDPVQRGNIMIRVFFEEYPKIWEILCQLKAALAINDQWAQSKLAEVYKTLTSGIISEINRGIEKGLIRKNIDPELLAFFLLAVAEAEVYRSRLDDKYSLSEITSFAGEFQFYGFLTSKGRDMVRTHLTGQNFHDLYGKDQPPHRADIESHA